jgi:hypothetical protein
VTVAIFDAEYFFSEIEDEHDKGETLALYEAGEGRAPSTWVPSCSASISATKERSREPFINAKV